MASELDSSIRFGFGSNWKNFHSVLDEERILQAEKSLKEMLGLESLIGKSFIDIGSGSGLFSLAAKRLGAYVVSFDYDQDSVDCTQELKRRYFPQDNEWKIEQGSALDKQYLASLGLFDVVYSWGVLHHTGAMWIGIENAISMVGNNGLLYLALYNDQGWKSRVWWLIKFFYNKLPGPLKNLYAYGIGLVCNFLVLIKYTLLLKPSIVFNGWINYKKRRGMSLIHDMIDWIGGFPFEYVSYSVLKTYLALRGFKLVRGLEAKSLGCHKMVFQRDGMDK